MHTGKFGGVGMILLLTAWVVPAAGQSLLINGQFEDGIQSIPSGQIGVGYEPAGTPDLSTAAFSVIYNSQIGNFQRISAGSLGRQAGLCQRVTSLTPGRLVTFAGSIYTKAAGHTAWVAIDPNNSLPAGSLPARTTQVPFLNGQWQTFELTTSVGPSGAVAVYVWAHFDSGSNSYINTDDLSLSYVPDRIDNLAVVETLSDAARLTWTTPAGASQFEIRTSTVPLTDANWSTAQPVGLQFVPVPGPAGTAHDRWIRELQPGTPYHVGIKFRYASGGWSNLSNIPLASTQPQGSAPYWAWITRNRLAEFHAGILADCQAADLNRGATAADPTNPLKWYFGGWDPDCEQQIGIGSVLTIVRDTWLLDFWKRLSDHVWDLTFANWPLDKNHYNNTWPREKIPGWNESHHAGECSWNGVGLVFHDYDEPKWLDRLEQYAVHVHNWTGYTGNPPHLHFKSFWMQAGNCDCAPYRNSYCQVDNAENRRFTRALWYAAWRDPNSSMPDGQTIRDFLYELDTAQADDAMRTDLGKPVGVIPAEIRFDTHQIGGYSGAWWRLAGSHGGTIGTSGEWWYDWRWGFVQSRDAYWEQLDQHLTSGYPNSLAAIRETIRYFSVDMARNHLPPVYLYDPPVYPWPDSNEAWGHYQYLVNYLYRAATGDSQFDEAFLGHANLLWQKMPPPGADRYINMIRSQADWDPAKGTGIASAKQPFMLAWLITRDKEWLCRAMDEMFWVDVGFWLEAVYNGMPSLAVLRLPDQPITWNNTSAFTNFAALVLEHDRRGVKWLTYNFDPADKPMSLWLWSLEPGQYVLRHGPDADLDDQMDHLAGSVPFTCTGRRTPIEIVMPAGRMEVFEIESLTCTTGPDGDGDGVGDACDACPGTVPGAAVDETGCPPTFRPDFDRDGDVDLDDFAYLQRCLTGMFNPVSDPSCSSARLDADTDVDRNDLAIYFNCVSGPDIPADPGCSP